MKKSYVYRVIDLFGNSVDGWRVTFTSFYSWPETRDWCRACHSEHRWIARAYDEKVVFGFMSEDGRFLVSNQDVEVSTMMIYMRSLSL